MPHRAKNRKAEILPKVSSPHTFAKNTGIGNPTLAFIMLQKVDKRRLRKNSLIKYI
jgi:hypothetical protein